MITAVDIENLRGIARGKLEGLAPLTILTGPNGCGKSTVLDALLIGGSSELGHAVGHTVRRRPETRDGARWLVRRGADSANLSIEATALKSPQTTHLNEVDESPDDPPGSPPFTSSCALYVGRNHDEGARVRFNPSNAYRVSGPGGLAGMRLYVRLIDPGLTNPLLKAFSEATRKGRRADAYAFLSDLIPGFESLDILTEEDGTPALYVTRRGSAGAVPVGLTGDGIQSFIELALELSALTNGLALIEEPEVYQHPRAIHRTAEVLLMAVRRRVQVVLSTHSLELIDALLGAAAETDLPAMALFNLALHDGQLRSSRYSGQDIAFNRTTIANDLR